MKKTDFLYDPIIFSLITCFGGICYGFFLGEFYQILTYPEQWTFTQNLSNVNYCLFNSLYPAGSFIGTLIAGYCTFRFGRVKTIFYTDIITIMAIIITISTNSFEPFFIGRFLMGVSTGINFPVMLILIKEFVLEKDYLRCAVLFQVSNTIGIFIANLICLSGVWRLAIGISIVFPILRLIYYYFKLLSKGIDTPLFMLNKNPEDCEKTLEKIYTKTHVQTLLNTVNRQETLLQKDFVMGDMFSPKYVTEIMFCISILFLNQSSGINEVLGYSGQYFSNNTSKHSIPIWFSLMNLIGGLTLLYTVPPANKKGFLKYIVGSSLSKGFIKFFTGTILIIVILMGFGLIIDFNHPGDNNVFIVLGCIYLLIFQQCLGCYPFVYIPIILPDIGVFMVLIIHSTFGMIASLSFYFGSDTFPIIFRFCFSASVIGIMIATFLFTKFLKDKALSVDVDYSALHTLEEENSLVDKGNLLELNKK